MPTSDRSSGSSTLHASSCPRSSAAAAGRCGVEQGRPQRVDVGLEEQRPLGRVAAGPEHQPTGGPGQVGGRVQEAGLPDPGLALDEDQPRRSRRRRPARRARSRRGRPPARPASAGTPSRAGAGLVRRRQSRAAGRGARRPSRRPGRCPARGAGAGPARRTSRGPRPSVPAAACARIRSRTARSSNGSAATASAATATAAGGSSRRQRRGQQVPGPSRAGRPPRRALPGPSRRPPRPPEPVGVPSRSSARREPAAASPCSPAPRRPAASSSNAAASSRSTDQSPSTNPCARPGALVSASPSSRRGATDQGGDVRGGIRGRTVGPEHVDDRVHRDQAAALGGQQGEQRAGLAGAEVAAPHAPPRRPRRVSAEHTRTRTRVPMPSSFPGPESTFSARVRSGADAEGAWRQRSDAGRRRPGDGCQRQWMAEGPAPPSGGVSLRPSLPPKVKESGRVRGRKQRKRSARVSPGS